MDSIETLTTFFGWCAAINFVILAITSLTLVSAKGFLAGVHSKMLGVEPQNLQTVYVQYLGNYKIAILVLNVVPWLALKMMV